MTTKSKKAWSGRFTKASHLLLEKFNASLSFDKRLYAEDIAGSMAHAKMLHRIGVLTASELKKILKGLEQVRREIESGRFQWSDALEDIHMAVESRLTDLIGPAGKKLHTARSRNDQVALDFRLYCKKSIQRLSASLKDLERAILTIAEKKGFIPMPGYTHLQRAQPILWAHHWLAYFEMLERDRSRLADTLKRTDVSPLGSGALAGSTFPVDRAFVARELGLSGVTRNSLDSVSDRDFAAELLFDIALLLAHLSRLAEEMILWSSQEFGFVTLPMEFCTGSSMMPQKVNPDVPELVRGKTGRAFGNLMALLTVIKGLPLAYNKDLQEDKEPVFDSLDTAQAVLEIFTAMIPGIEPRPGVMKAATAQGFLLATDLAEYLVSKNVPFREAHEISGKLVRHCLLNNTTLESLSLNELREFSKSFGPDVRSWLDVEAAINKRSSVGGTAAARVKKEIGEAKKMLGR